MAGNSYSAIIGLQFSLGKYPEGITVPYLITKMAIIYLIQVKESLRLTSETFPCSAMRL